MRAFVFDVDGTLAETEDAHRRAFNAVFRDFGLDWHWDLELNRELLAVSGAIERMSAFQQRLPDAARVDQSTLEAMQRAKRDVYREMIADGSLAPRPGVLQLLGEARAEGIALAIATASGRESLAALFAGTFRQPVETLFDVVVTAEDVRTKKPDPEVYLVALDRLGLSAPEALVFEDSPVGYRAARAAGLSVVVTPSEFGPHDADFSEATVVPSLAPENWPRFGFHPRTAAPEALRSESLDQK
ncbi:HAD-IA family hydrolase [Tropicimonas sp. IMCC34043]|uniref:HAD-IA family hydrolase n=1 Tax=Tropicimonas sp. IMCC34043 TaxID=2248760 RepID=UPI000E277EE6|nr:HAD-IA family hydrolase [Tropicimonas sp. IMCC34043]